MANHYTLGICPLGDEKVSLFRPHSSALGVSDDGNPGLLLSPGSRLKDALLIRRYLPTPCGHLDDTGLDARAPDTIGNLLCKRLVYLGGSVKHLTAELQVAGLPPPFPVHTGGTYDVHAQSIRDDLLQLHIPAQVIGSSINQRPHPVALGLLQSLHTSHGRSFPVVGQSQRIAVPPRVGHHEVLVNQRLTQLVSAHWTEYRIDLGNDIPPYTLVFLTSTTPTLGAVGISGMNAPQATTHPRRRATEYVIMGLGRPQIPGGIIEAQFHQLLSGRLTCAPVPLPEGIVVFE